MDLIVEIERIRTKDPYERRRSDSKEAFKGDTRKSSSEEMVPSKAPKDVLGLGMHLVRELGLAGQ
jgi:hypothetical protein